MLDFRWPKLQYALPGKFVKADKLHPVADHLHFSTYCLWPAIANVNVVHFPMTYLIAGKLIVKIPELFIQTRMNRSGVDNANLIVNLTENFNWIRETEIISNFNKFKPWQKIIDVLIGNETY